MQKSIAASLLLVAVASKACEICEMLGKDNIQGLKSGFMAGNQVYYVGGRYNCWNKMEDETVGLTHPFYHDLRSRGDAIAHYNSVGTGNDFSGWVAMRARGLMRETRDDEWYEMSGTRCVR